MIKDDILKAFKEGIYSAEEVLALLKASEESVALSENQHGLWLLHKLAPTSAAYNVPICFRTDMAFSEAQFEQACRLVLQRHPVLTGCFAEQEAGSASFQAFSADNVEQSAEVNTAESTNTNSNQSNDDLLARLPLQLSFHHQDSDDNPSSNDNLLSDIATLAAEPFDLTRNELIRFNVFSDAASQTRTVLIVVHHIVFDGSSIPVLLEELLLSLQAFSEGKTPQLPEITSSYSDYVNWEKDYLQGEAGKSAKAYWSAQLAGSLPALQLANETDSADSALNAVGQTHSQDLSVQQCEQITALCKQLRINNSVLFLGLFNIVLSRYCNEQDIVVGMPTQARPAAEFDQLIGYFVNMIPLRSQVEEHALLSDYLQELALTLMDGVDHASYPFPQLVRDLGLSTQQHVNPVFQVAYAYQNQSMVSFVASEAGLAAMEAIDVVESIQQQGEFKLSLEVLETPQGFTLTFKYDANKYSAAMITTLMEHYTRLLDNVLVHYNSESANSDTNKENPKIVDFHFCSSEEAHRELVLFNQTEQAFPDDVCVHTLFEAQAEANPNAIALTFAGDTLSYQQLNERANQLAHWLRSEGVGPDTLVGLCLERSFEMVIGIVAILKAGGAWVPIDPGYPQERVQYMVQDANTRIILSQSHLQDLLTKALGDNQTSSQVLFLDTACKLSGESISLNSQPSSNLPVQELGLTADHLAYLIYTSGSTGKPKGVMIPHKGLVNRVHWMGLRYGMTPDDVVLQKTPFSFDVSVWEFIWPLISGARLVIAKPEGHKEPAYLCELIREQQVTKLHFVPSMLSIMLAHENLASCPSIKQVFCSGEALSKALVNGFFSSNGLSNGSGAAELHNLYGPTEASIDVSDWQCDPESPLFTVPIGKPIDNTQLYVLDSQQRPLPQGLAGELYIGGIGLARGYLNQPALTEQKFIDSPFSSEHKLSQKLYKTGDLARRLPDGNLDFIGRIDNQVKLRGFRVELGEIETQLMDVAPLAGCAVVIKADQQGEERLIAYLVAKQPEQRGEQTSNDADLSLISESLTPEILKPEILKQKLAEQLPDYMVPSAFVNMSELPLTPNGKLDQRALPMPDADAFGSQSYVPPETDVEHKLASIWQDLLFANNSDKNETVGEIVGREDNFFHLGGHSLLATSVVSQVRNVFGVEMPLQAFFEQPVLKDLAKVIENLNPSLSIPLTPVDRSQPLALSYAQQRLWFLAELEQSSANYNIPLALRFKGELNVAAMSAALDAIVARHEVLRTRFVSAQVDQELAYEPEQALELDLEQIPEQTSAQVYQVIDAPFDFNLQAEAVADEASAQAIALEEAASDFDLSLDALIRARLLQINSDDHVLLVTMHHSVSDGWSLGVFFRELTAFYDGFADNQQAEVAPELAPLPIQYADYAKWQREWFNGETQATQLAYWREQLAELEPMSPLASDRHRPAIKTYAGAVFRGELPASLKAQLESLSQQHNATLYMTLLAAFKVLLVRYSGQTDIAVGSPIANRNRAELESLIGFFVNTLVMRTDMSGDPSFSDLLERVKTMSLAAYAHQDIPFDYLVEQLQPERSTRYSPFFQIMFAVQNMPLYQSNASQSGSDLTVTGFETNQRSAKFDLTVNWFEQEPTSEPVSGLSCELEYNTDLFDADTIARLYQHYLQLLTAVVQHPHAKMSAFELMQTEEYTQVLSHSVGNQASYPLDTTPVQLFEQCAALKPTAIALSSLLSESANTQSMSYGELNQQANQLAHYLVKQGVQKGDLVAIAMPTRLEMVIGFIAINKAGAAYVPIDTSLPEQRLQYLFRDANPKVLLTHSSLLSVLMPALPSGGLSGRVISLDTECTTVNACSIDNLTEAPDAMGLANVIYTSGSTGQPKGVQVRHRGIVRLMKDNQFLDYNAGTVSLQCSTMIFDAATLEIWPVLGNGGRVVLYPDNFIDVEKVITVVNKERVNTLFLTIGLFNQMSLVLAPMPSLKYLMTGGDVVKPAIVDTFYQALPDLQVVHAYGPTENTVFTTCYTVPRPVRLDRPLPLGNAVAGTQCYVLDSDLQLLPVGAIGELCLAGDGVSAGYLNKPEQSEQAFVANPFTRDGNARLYRTGDLVRRLANGHLEFAGRADSQVKLRGFRIELGEIESALLANLAVENAVVVIKNTAGNDGESSEKKLVAYVVLAESGAESPNQELATPEALKQSVAETLPDYMVPSAYVILPDLPLTITGKVDYRALPMPQVSDFDSNRYVAPQTAEETLLAKEWANVLNLDWQSISRYDNFFGLGGHSLLMINYRAALLKQGYDLPILELYKGQTLADLAKQLEAAKGANLNASTQIQPLPAPGIPENCAKIAADMLPMLQLEDKALRAIERQVNGGALNIQDIYPLSPLQQGMLFHAMSTPHADPYVTKSLLKCATPENYQHFIDAVKFVFSRHDIMRTQFIYEQVNEPVQVVLREVEVPVEEIALPQSVLSGEQDAETWLIEHYSPLQETICLDGAPLIRLKVARTNSAVYVVFLHHHAIEDDVSLRVIEQEIDAFVLGKTDTLTAPTQYRDFIWQSLQLNQTAMLDYFASELAGFDSLASPLDCPEKLSPNATMVRSSVSLPKSLVSELEALAQKQNVSLSSLLHLAWSLVLSGTSGQKNVVFGSVLSGRMQPIHGIDNMVGLCLNTLPMHIAIDSTDVATALGETHEKLNRLMSYELASLSAIQQHVQDNNADRSKADKSNADQSPLFNTILNCRLQKDARTVDLQINNAAEAGIEALWSQEHSNYPVSASVDFLDGELTITMEVQQGLEPRRFHDYFEAALAGILNSASAETSVSSASLASINIMGVDETHRLLSQFNPPALPDWDLTTSVVALFEQHAAQTPDAIALELSGNTLSYGELNGKANQLAHVLQTRLSSLSSKYEPEQADNFVAICTSRSMEMIVAILATLKAGAAYMPIDPGYPAQRIAHMLSDAKPALVLVDSSTHSLMNEQIHEQDLCELLAVDAFFEGALDKKDKKDKNDVNTCTNPEPLGGNRHLAYLLYTSGSTGLPKGVMVEHRQLLNFVYNAKRTYDMSASDRTLQFSTISFDISVEEIFATLCSGARLVLRTEQWLNDADTFWQLCAEHDISVLSLPTAYWHSIVGSAKQNLPQSLRVVIVGGEAISPSKVSDWFNAAANSPELPRLFNTYGPTETTVTATTFEVAANTDLESEISIGRPNQHTQIYVLDAQLNLLPQGAVGEMFIAGDSVARGYLNRDTETQQAFIANPFASDDETNSLLYRTGDLVRWRDDGNLMFVGRADKQVKIRGFRVELPEIEQQLAQHPSVQDVAVVVRELAARVANTQLDRQGSNKQLVAYVVLSQDDDNETSLHQFLQEKLPEYMVPSAIVPLSELPLTVNGKLDEKALPAPELSDTQAQDYAAPNTRHEQVLCAVMADVLGLEKVGINDNFFALGGNSILSIQVISRAREQGLNLNMRDLFTGQSIANLAANLEVVAEENGEQSHSQAHVSGIHLPAITVSEHPEYLPLSFTQRRLWIVSQVENESAGYNLPVAFSFDGKLSVAALQKAFELVIRRHATLRTVFREDEGVNNGQPYQLILNSDQYQFVMSCHDLSEMPAEVRDQKVSELADADAMLPFDLSQDLMLRVSLLKLADEQHVLLLNKHHIASDGWSLNVMFKEMLSAYDAIAAGELVNLPELPIQFADYALWQQNWMQGEVLQTHLDYWRHTLTGIQQLHNLPLDRPRPAQRSYRGGSVQRVLNSELTQSLNAFNQANGTSLFMSLQAMLATLIHRYSGDEDIAIGFSISNRVHQEIEGLIGFFANTLVLRSDISGNPTFSDFLSATRERSLSALAHQHLPFELLVEELNPERSLSHSPLFQVILVVDNNPTEFSSLSDADDSFTVTPVKQNFPVSKFDLSLFANYNEQGELCLNWVYATDLFDASTIERMAQHFEILLKGALANPDLHVGELPLITPAEQQTLLVDWNNTAQDYPRDACLHQLFEEQVELHPNAEAVRFEDQSLTYRELNAKANQLAHHLIELGVQPDQFVGVCIERSIEMLVALLGVMKAGGAYVPLDPSYPKDRREYILSDSNVSIVVTQSVHQEELLEDNISTRRLVLVDDYRDLILSKSVQSSDQTSDQNPSIANLNSGHLVYIIYTSGSTGRPKGVAVNHQSVSNFLNFARRQFMPTFDDGSNVEGAVVSSTLAFDATVGSLYPPLVCGGYVELLPDDDRLLGRLADCLLDQSRSLLFKITPAHLKAIANDSGLVPNPVSKHVVVIAGEQLTEKTLYRWKYELLTAAELVNEYGPTEATVGSTTYHGVVNQTVSADSLRGIPIGKPLDNIRLYVVNDQWHLQPVGVAGELYIGGECLAREYLNQPEMTAEKFIQSPVVLQESVQGEQALAPTQHGERLYRTGDQVRWLPDGSIEFIGRLDHQVKIRGFRIELGEIEAQLLQQATVSDVVVLAKEDDDGEKKLIAYTVRSAEGLDIDNNVLIGLLRERLAERLPEYMVPASFSFTDSIPLTPNGKINRAALLAMEEESVYQETFVAPRNDTEQALCDIWADVLQVEQVGIRDNFFASGGDSILSIQVISRARELGIDISMRQMFEGQTVEALSGFEEETEADSTVLVPPITQMPRPEYLPLSFTQRRLWIISQVEQESTGYNLPNAFKLSGEFSLAAFEQAFDLIIERHATLRTVFREDEGKNNGQPYQLILDKHNGDYTFSIPLIDLTALSPKEQAQQVTGLANADALKSFDLANDLMIRLSVLKLSEQEHVMLMNRHHIASDGWSLNVMIEELLTAYDAIVAEQPVNLPELPVQFADYALWQQNWMQGEVLHAHLDYWRETLDGVQQLHNLPLDRPRPAQRSYKGEYHNLVLDSDTTKALQAFNEQQKTTLFMTLQALLATLIHRYSGDEDIAIGFSISNRVHQEIESLIGFFANTLVLRSDISGNPTFSDFLSATRDRSLAALAHQHLPFELLVEELNPERSLSHSPLFQVMLVVDNNPHVAVDDQDGSGVTVSPVDQSFPVSKFDLSLYAHYLESGELLLGWAYATDLFDASTIERMAQHFEILLKGALANPDLHVGELPLNTPAEQQTLLVDWNNTAQDYPRDACLHQLFEEQVELHPNAEAVRFEDQSLTYRELNAKANQLAHHLIELGVQPDQFVGVCIERSIEMLVALLGVMKAGGAYVPLDPSYPKDRREYILSDSNVSIVVTQSVHQEELLEDNISTRQLVLVDDYRDLNFAKSEQSSDQNPSIANLNSGHLVYIIYTSGSTGRPKGVAVNHQSVSNFLNFARRQFMPTFDDGSKVEGAVVSSTLAFDATVGSLYPPLVCGGYVELLPDDDRLLGRLADCLLDQSRSLLFKITPAHLKAIANDSGLVPNPVSKHVVVIAGEQLTEKTLYRWKYELLTAAELVNEYGPTEATVGSTTYHGVVNQTVSADSLRGIPIGKPLDNIRLYVVNDQWHLQPVGVAGELYIGGECLAREYLNQPEMTAEKFISSPIVLKGDNALAPTQNGERLYRTGDQVRWLPDGSIEFIGRLDHQVKIRGFRIELGEIEAQLLQQATVSDVVVLAKEDDDGEKKLIAYTVRSAEGLDIDNNVLIGLLRERLAERLPEYMVPASFSFTDSIPLTPNGKINRAALLAMEEESVYQETFVAPRNDTEQALCDIWADVLQVEQVGIRDNFFASGGDSILSIQVISRARELGIDISMRQMFEGQTVEALSGFEEGENSESSLQAEQGEVTGEQILLPIQRWFLEGDKVDQHYFHQSTILAVPAGFDVAALHAVMAALYQRHDALRLRFTATEQGWQGHYQPLSGAMLSASVEHIPLLLNEQYSGSDKSSDNRSDKAHLRQKLQEQLSTYVKNQFSLTAHDNSLFKALLFTTNDPADTRLVLIAHHLLVDGVTWRIVLSDLSRAFAQFKEQSDIALASKSSAYQQWAQGLQDYAANSIDEQEKAYWLNTLQSTVQPLPTDSDANAGISADISADENIGETADNRQGSSANVSLLLSEPETRLLLREAHGAYDTRINDLLLAALQLAFKRWCGRDVLRVRMESHGREPLFDHLDVSETAGWFTTVFPLQLNAIKNQTDASAKSELTMSGALIKQIKAINQAIPQNGIGYGLLRYLQEDADIIAAEANFAFDIAFNYLGQFDHNDSNNNLGELSDFMAVDEPVGAEISPQRARPYPLRFGAAVAQGQLGFSLEYNRHHYHKRTMDNLAELYRSALQEIIAHCTGVEKDQLTLVDFPLAQSDRERLDKWQQANATNGSTQIQEKASTDKQCQPFFPLSTFADAQQVNCPVPYSQKMFLHFTKKRSLQPVLRTFRVVTLVGDLNIGKLEQAFQQLVQRHAAFQMRFAQYQGHEVLQIDRTMPADFKVLGMGSDRHSVLCEAGDMLECSAKQMMLEEINRPYDLRKGQFVRCLVIKRSEHEHHLVMGMNHLVCDRWSWGVFQTELETLYNRAVRSGDAKEREQWQWPDLPAQLGDFPDYCYWNSYWHTTPAYQQQLAYWQDVFGGLQWSQTFPTDLDKDLQVVDGKPGGKLSTNHELTIEQALFEQIDAYCRERSITLYTLFMAAFQLVLAHYAKQTDIVVVSPKAERDLPELANTVGLYLNLLPVHSTVKPELSLGDYVKQVADNMVSAQANLDVQIEAVLETLNCDTSLPISDVNFQYYNFAQETPWQLNDLHSEQVFFTEGELEYENTLDLRLSKEEDGVMGVFVYNGSKYLPETINRLSSGYIATLRALIDEDGQKVSNLFEKMNEFA